MISSTGKDIYLLPGAEPVKGYLTAHLTEIPEEEYEDLRKKLVEGGMLADMENESTDTAPHEPGPNSPPETAARSPVLMRLERQEEEIQLLTACLLELSEIVYQ